MKGITPSTFVTQSPPLRHIRDGGQSEQAVKNVEDDKTFLSAKISIVIYFVNEVISNKPFELFKALNPGLELLEYSIHCAFVLPKSNISNFHFYSDNTQINLRQNMVKTKKYVHQAYWAMMHFCFIQ